MLPGLSIRTPQTLGELNRTVASVAAGSAVCYNRPCAKPGSISWLQFVKSHDDTLWLSASQAESLGKRLVV